MLFKSIYHNSLVTFLLQNMFHVCFETSVGSFVQKGLIIEKSCCGNRATVCELLKSGIKIKSRKIKSWSGHNPYVQNTEWDKTQNGRNPGNPELDKTPIGQCLELDQIAKGTKNEADNCMISELHSCWLSDFSFRQAKIAIELGRNRHGTWNRLVAMVAQTKDGSTLRYGTHQFWAKSSVR